MHKEAVFNRRSVASGRSDESQRGVSDVLGVLDVFI